MSLDPLAAVQFVPSEEVLLNGAILIPKGGLLDKFQLLGSDVAVSKKQLACTVYAAAFLGAEAAGELQLKLRPKKTLLGLRTVQALYAEPAGDRCPWPAQTFEAALRPLAERLLANKAKNEVGEILYQYLDEDCTDPLGWGVQLIYTGPAARGLLAKVSVKRLAVFTVQQLELPETTATLATAAAPRSAGLIEACRSARPDVWKALLAQIDGAFTRRRESPDIDTDN